MKRLQLDIKMHNLLFLNLKTVALKLGVPPSTYRNAGSLTTGENKHLHNKANVLQHNIHTYMSD